MHVAAFYGHAAIIGLLLADTRLNVAKSTGVRVISLEMASVDGMRLAFQLTRVSPSQILEAPIGCNALTIAKQRGNKDAVNKLRSNGRVKTGKHGFAVSTVDI